MNNNNLFDLGINQKPTVLLLKAPETIKEKIERINREQNPTREAININMPKFYKSISEYLNKNADLPNWRNDSTPLNEINMWRINNEIRTKFDDVEVDTVKRKINFKIDGLNVKSIDFKNITKNDYTNDDKALVDKIPTIEDDIKNLSYDFGEF